VPRKVRGKAAATLLMLVAGLVVGLTQSAHASQTFSEPVEAANVPQDVKSVTWWDDSSKTPSCGAVVATGSTAGDQGCVYYSVKFNGPYTTAAPITATDTKLDFTLDLYGATPTTTAPDGVPGDLCFTVESPGGNWHAILFAQCGQQSGNSYVVSRTAPDTILVTIPRSELIAAGLSATGTFYNFRLQNRSTTPTDQFPDATTAVLRHDFGQSPPPPPPPPGAQQAFTEQGVNAGNPGAGVLTISTVQNNVALGSAPPNSVKVAPVGAIDYTNTLADGNNWNVTVEATSLHSSAANMHFSNLAFTGGSTIAQVPAGAGANPTPSTTKTAFGVAGDPDPTPGSSYNPTPIVIANADQSIQGAFEQTGSTLTLTVPSGQAAGSYSGKLRYTITG